MMESVALSSRPTSAFTRLVSAEPFRRETGDGGTILTTHGGIYKLESVLGVGGLSVVYMATRFSDKLTVALKVPNANAKSCKDAAQLIKREARILCRLNHLNIVKVVEEGYTSAGEPYMALDLVRAQTLDVLMTANGGRLPLQRGVNICLQVCDALAHAHDNGIVHRDLKPGNVLVSTINGVDKVTLFDFGIASEDGDESEVGDCGSLLYASPEQLENRVCSPRADVYQAALLMFETLTGKLPFEREVFPAVQYRHGDLPLLPDNSDLGSAALPLDLREALEQALAPNPDRRPASMNMFGYKVRQVLKRLRLTRLRYTRPAEKITA